MTLPYRVLLLSYRCRCCTMNDDIFIYRYSYSTGVLYLSNPSKPKSSSKLITNPISPETSTNENPMKAYRNNSSRCDGFLPMDISNEP